MSVLPPFALHRPQSLSEALEALGEDDMPLAGGTELLLAMRMRMLRPSALVNLKTIPGLDRIGLDGSELAIGGTVTHAAAMADPLVARHAPILPHVLAQVGNPRVRASGTLAGNLVFAEPKSDVITILAALDASVDLVSPRGERRVRIDEFIVAPYYAAREHDEILTAIRIPVDDVVEAAYVKFQTMERPTVGVAAVDRRGEDGDVRRIVVGAVCETPFVRDHRAGEPIDGPALAAEIDVVADIAGGERYKRHVTGVYIDRAVAALEEAVR